MSDENQSRSTFREYLEALLIAALFLGFSNTFVLKTFFIPSGSMEDTLLIGDHLIVNRFVFGGDGGGLLPQREVQRGDIVIFRSPQQPEQDLVKRCVGVAGDKVELIQKQLYINDHRVDDHGYTKHTDTKVAVRRTPFNGRLYERDNFGPFTVPEGSYFCLGDNRDNSLDSRFWGEVPKRFVKGRAGLIYWSNGGETSDGTWSDASSEIARLGRTALGFFTKSRWERTFKLPR